MSCATAKRWFVPKSEYRYKTEDYALVGETAEQVSQEISAYDNETRHEWAEELENNSQWLARLGYCTGCYGFAMQGKLIYADVNEKDPKHKEKVYGSLAREPDLEAETEEAATAVRELVEFSKEEQESDDMPPVLFTKALRTGELELEIVDYLIQLKTKEATQTLLNVLSRQSKRKTPRPVMILLAMIDKGQTDKRGLTEGWAISYDFLKGLLIIKPFSSKNDRHPLCDAWYGKVSDDDVSFIGTPALFAKNFVDLGGQIGSNTKFDGLKLLVHSFVAGWILQQWKGLSSVEPGIWTEVFRDNILDALDKLDTILKASTFAVKEKIGKQKLPMEAFDFLAKQLADEEGHFRLSAIEARKNGNKEAAQDAAVFYERLMKDLKSFNESPKHQSEVSDKANGEAEEF